MHKYNASRLTLYSLPHITHRLTYIPTKFIYTCIYIYIIDAWQKVVDGHMKSPTPPQNAHARTHSHTHARTHAWQVEDDLAALKGMISGSSASSPKFLEAEVVKSRDPKVEDEMRR